MKISLNWLTDYVTWTETDTDLIVNRITAGTAEVDGVEKQGALLENCCVGKILTVKPHPNADKLRLCEVETDRGVMKVVCGGTNLEDHMLVAFAHVGATVRHGDELVTLQTAKIRGEESQGMLCAAEELDLSAHFPPKPEHGSRPIMDLTHSGFQPQQDLRAAMGMTDTVLIISNTAITTRPDLFSHIGFARECVALGIATWNKKQPDLTPPTFGKASLPVIRSEDPSLAPRYVSCVIELKTQGTTPEWMKQRLESVGIRSLSLPIDVTNYVMLDIGTPLHAFDMDTLAGELVVRESQKGEKVTTLDGVTRTLEEGLIVMSDDKGIFDLCGVMGDQRSAMTDATKRIFLHAPVFDSPRIRKAIQTTGHRTDASTVFEKGVPPVMVLQGLSRALRLILEHAPESSIESKNISWGEDGKPEPIELSLERASATLGMTVPKKAVTEILTDLGFAVMAGKKGILEVTPPLHRLRDIAGEHDLIEEIGRIAGYASVPEEMPLAPVRVAPRDQRKHMLRDALAMAGYSEIVPLNLVSPSLLKKAGTDPAEAIALANPLGEETSVMHTTTLPALLVHAQKNILQVEHALRTFHCAHVFRKGQTESMELTAFIAARANGGLLEEPLLHLKRDIVHALEAIGYDVSVTTKKDPGPGMHPGRSAEIAVNGRKVGCLYELHPTVCAAFDLPARAAAVTLNLTMLFAEKPADIFAAPVPAFPDVTYDETIQRTQKDAVETLLKKARAADPLLADVSVKDLYNGKPLKDGEYNLTLRFTYRAADRTLTEDEAKKVHEKVLGAMK